MARLNEQTEFEAVHGTARLYLSSSRVYIPPGHDECFSLFRRVALTTAIFPSVCTPVHAM